MKNLFCKILIIIFSLAFAMLGGCTTLQSPSFIEPSKSSEIITFNSDESFIFNASYTQSAFYWNENIYSGTLPSKYDSRDYGLVSPVNDQGNNGNCWAHTTESAVETALLKSGVIFDENEEVFTDGALENAFYFRQDDPLGLTPDDTNYRIDPTNQGGSTLLSGFFLSQWSSPVKVGDTYDGGYSDYRMEDFVMLGDTPDVDTLKRAIITYGSVAIGYYCTDQYDEYNHEYYTNYYTTSTERSNHAVLLVGYDDTIEKSSFNPNRPTQNGAFIVKNSWGTSVLNDGFFYMSYDLPVYNAVCYEYTSDIYDYNYYYDGASSTLSLNVGTAGNIFTAQKGVGGKTEYLKAVSVGIASEFTDCTIQVYKGVLNKPTTGVAVFDTPVKASFNYKGLYTINLPQEVELDCGEKFSIVVTLSSRTNSGVGIYVSTTDTSTDYVQMIDTTQSNQSFLTSNFDDLHSGITASDGSGGTVKIYGTARIKGFTVVR